MTIFIIIWGAWLIAEIALNRTLRSKNKNCKDYDKGSTSTIWRVIGIANILAIASACFIHLTISSYILVPGIGLFFIFFGMLGRVISIRMLGKMFTVDVNIADDHRIVKSGVYKYIRHPAYLGAIISFVGFGLSLNNWLSLLIVSILVPLVMVHRIKIEEEALIERFGDEYSQYMKNTYRLFPLVY
jgi:protein-S-isoprenylcysteine O-methyltransferase Ste14